MEGGVDGDDATTIRDMGMQQTEQRIVDKAYTGLWRLAARAAWPSPRFGASVA